MMRSPYQSPPRPPARRFLRRPRPPENLGRRKLVIAASGAVLAYLLYSFLLSDTGVLKIVSLRSENEQLKKDKIQLALRASELDRRRREEAKDPLLEERIARERFHLVKKGEIVYRFKDPSDSAR